jgi:hypothetical protein
MSVARSRHTASWILLLVALACSSEKPSTPESSSAGAQAAPEGAAGATSQARDAATPAADGGSGGRAESGRGGGSSDAGAAGNAGAAAGETARAGSAADAGARDAGSGDADAGGAAACGRCSAYAAPLVAGNIGSAELSALSGLAVSHMQPEIVFAHNDHDRPVVYALDLQGRLHAELTLEGAQTDDIEDIAAGKCDDKRCVYLADVGDNAARRTDYSILRFVEPEVPSTPGSAALTPSFEQLRFQYEDGSHNAESLLVAPDGTLYIITKLGPGTGGSVTATGPSSVYRIDASAFAQDTVAQASKVTTLTVPAAGEPALSAAAAHPCGLGFLARTYDRVYEFLVPPGAAFEAAFMATPEVVAMPDEPQSEGIDYLADGRGFVTSGEGMSAPLMLTQCAP